MNNWREQKKVQSTELCWSGRRAFYLIRLIKHLTSENNMQATEHSVNMYTLKVVFKDIRVAQNVTWSGTLKYKYNLFLPNKWTGVTRDKLFCPSTQLAAVSLTHDCDSHNHNQYTVSILHNRRNNNWDDSAVFRYFRIEVTFRICRLHFIESYFSKLYTIAEIIS